MANAKVGGRAAYGIGAFVEKLDSNRALTVGDSGKVFMLANTGAITVTFPDISAMSTQEKEAAIGWNATFIVRSTPGGAATIGCSSGDGNLLFGSHVGADDINGVGLNSAADDLIFGTAAVPGDRARVIYDGVYYYAWAQSADGDHITWG